MINSGRTFLAYIVLSLLLCVGAHVVNAAENVAAVRSDADDNWVLDTAVASPYYPPTSHLRPVGVYTSEEIDMMLQGVKQRLDKIQNANALIEQKVQEAETRLRGEVKSSLEALPQRLLATDAMKDLKESLLEELHRELAQLRQDLQKQVDELKQARKQ
jgi:hypothetical protein